MRTKEFHIIFFFLIWNFSFAQEYTNFSVAEGLPSNHVYRLVQDKQGFIWVLTDKGMARFNGKEFKTFTTRDGLPTNDIWDIRIGPDNKVWYFSKSSTLGYILNDSVYNFPSCSPNTIMYPNTTFQIGNTFLIGIGSGIDPFAIIDGCWQKIDNAGNIKLPLENNKKLSEKDKQNVLAQLYSSSENIFGVDDANMERNMRLVSHDSLLVMITSDGYSFYNIITGKTYSESLPIKLTPQRAYFNRVTFANDEIQIAGFSYLASLNKDFTISELIQIPNDLQSHYSFRDKTGNIWAATFSNGIYMLPQIKGDIEYLLPGNKVKLFCTATEPAIANVLDDGFYEYKKDSASFKKIASEKGFIYSAKYIPELKTNYLISESHILFNHHGELKRISNIPLGIKNLLYCDGVLYGLISQAIIELNPTTLVKIDSYEQNGMTDLVHFQNKLILGTSNGLAYLEKETIHKYNTTELYQKPILKLYNTSDNLLLVCTDGFGAYLTDLEKTIPLVGSEFLSVESAFVENNEIWLTSEIGVLHYSKIAEEYQLVEKLDENNGLLSKGINSIVVLEKEIMLGTDNGVVIIPKNQKKIDQLLDVYFAAANFNTQSLLGEKKNFQYASNNDLTIGVSSIDYSQSAEDIGFEYKLLPIQKEWSKTTSKEIHFTDLSPNDYEVWIKRGAIEKSISFSIIPLWWQRSESKAGLVFLLVLLVTAGIYKYQKFQIKKRFKAIITQKKIAENELYALRAQMNPHFVFNSLASIQYYINENNFEISEKYLVKFSKLIRQFFELSKQEEVTLETEIKLLENYLDIEQLRFKEKLRYHIKIDPFLNLQEIKIPTMLLQPIVENAVNHGIFNKVENGHIDLNFYNAGQNEFIVDIVDDGVGFANSKKKAEGRISSSSVLQNRIDILNRSNQWSITFSNREAFPEELEVGNISTFNIKKII